MRIAQLAAVIAERFLSFEGLPPSGRLLEIGCGAGNQSLELAVLGYEVSGIDFSETAISWGRERSQSIDFRVGNITDLSCFAEGFFDVVYDGNCVHCLLGEDRAKALRESWRVLRTGGIFFLSSLCASEPSVLFEGDLPYRHVATRESLIQELLEAGFEIGKVFVREESPIGHVNVHAVKKNI